MKALARIALTIVFCVSSLPSFAQQFDVLIRNGKVVDGSGNPWKYADIGIVGDHITFVGKAPEQVQAKRTIDARGLIVAPGFIDMLGQSELNLLIDKQAVSKLTQGIKPKLPAKAAPSLLWTSRSSMISATCRNTFT